MFTGVIEDLGELARIRRAANGLTLEIRTGLPRETLPLGSSLAVDGVCLTVAAVHSDTLTVDVSHESMNTTTLGSRKARDRVHLERALLANGRLGGHLVTGHVDGVGQVVARTVRGANVDLVVRVPRTVEPYLVPKGSVAVDGVSLTVNEPRGGVFRVTLIPHTLGATTLGERRPGDQVNLEADILGKYVRHFVGVSRPAVVDEHFLAENGFSKPEEK